jgi:hypothetical protein
MEGCPAASVWALRASVVNVLPGTQDTAIVSASLYTVSAVLAPYWKDDLSDTQRRYHAPAAQVYDTSSTDYEQDHSYYRIMLQLNEHFLDPLANV